MSMLRARLQRLQGKTSEPKNVEADLAADNNEEAAAMQYKSAQVESAQIATEQSATKDAGAQRLAANQQQQNIVEHDKEPDKEPDHDLLLELAPLPSAEPFAECWSDMQVQQAKNEFGSFLLRSLSFGSDAAIGMHKYGEWQHAATYLNAFHPDNCASAEQFLFLDLETTGLGSGTGNVPFMVGLAYWKQHRLIVEQALIRHPAEERAMLAYVHHLTARFTHLVTYNGKSFDWPLMHSRYVMNGMRQRIWEPLHIDLLHPSRAIWRNTLESCKLSHIEKMRLGIIRVDDLPGAEAPARYFQYLNSGDPALIADVYRHNEIDMLSLVTLAIRFGHLLSNRNLTTIVQQPSEPEEMVRTGLWLERMNCCEYAEQLFQLAAHIPAQRTQTLMLLAMRDKKVKNMERAVQLWKQIVEDNTVLAKREQAEAATELSMYYEHTCKQFEQALSYAELAKERLSDSITVNSRSKASKARELEQLNKRIERIKKKCVSTV